jgi:hypothetical protein
VHYICRCEKLKKPNILQKCSSILENIFPKKQISIFQIGKIDIIDFSKMEKNSSILEKILPFWKFFFHFGKFSSILEKYSLFWKNILYFGKIFPILEK